MTNFEKLKEMSVEEIATYLCNLSECSSCPHGNDCAFPPDEKYKNGFQFWLEEEADA